MSDSQQYGDNATHAQQSHIDTLIGGSGHTVNQTTINQAPPPPLAFPISNLQEATIHFVGRTDQLTALANNAANDPTAITQTIAGLGGVGKTQLMRYFAQKYRGNFDIVWWVRVDEAWAEDMLTLGRVLRLPVDGVNQATGLTTVRNWLCGCEKAWLLLCDNADVTPPAQLRPLLPSNPLGRILITSRNTQWAGGARPVRLDVFSREESGLFWRERLGASTAEEEVARAALAEELGHLPLALEHAAAYMGERGKSAEGYLQLYRTQRQRLWAHTPPPNDYHATVATTWQVSFEQVQKTEGAAELLALCAFVAPDDIPLELMVANLEEGTAVAQLLGDELVRDEAVGVLRRYALLGQSEAGGLAMHRLVQVVYRDGMGEGEARGWVVATGHWLRGAYLFDSHDMKTWPAAGRLLPHLQVVVAEAERWGIENEQVAGLNTSVGFYLQQHGQLWEARLYTARALTMWEKVVGEENPYTVQSLNNMGGLMEKMGELEKAWSYYKRALALCKRMLGDENSATATVLNNMGGVFESRGEFEKALPYYKCALAIREKVLGIDHLDTANSLNSMGYLLQAMGKLAEAQPYYERALAIRKKRLEADHPDTAASLNNMGYLLQARGKLAEAQLYYARALAIWEKVRGENHLDTAQGLNNLAVLAYYMEDYPEAARLMRRALVIREQKLGSNHPHTQGSCQSLADIEAKLAQS